MASPREAVAAAAAARVVTETAGVFGAVVVLLEPHDSRGGELAPGGAAFA